MLFPFPSHKIAEFAAGEIGEKEHLKASEQYSYGADPVRDGVSTGKDMERQTLVSYSDIQSLPDLGFAPIFPDICYHLTHYKPAAADIPVASDNPAHYADAIRYNARTPLQGSLLPLTRLVWA
nr:hypothetical protein p201703316-2__00091 [Shigella sonnei]